MGEPIDAVEIVNDNLWHAILVDGERSVGVSSGADLLGFLFAAGGVEGDGDLVLRREGGKVTVAGRLEVSYKTDNLYRIVGPSDG